jgi:hypothetical protein
VNNFAGFTEIQSPEAAETAWLRGLGRSGLRSPAPRSMMAGVDPVAQDLELAVYELFSNKEELLPLWLRLREHIESFGDDVRLKVRDRFLELDRGGSVFALVEPTADHQIELGLHNPGLPVTKRFREAVGFGSRRITHRVSVPENAEIDDELHARLHDAYLLALEGEPS